MASGLGLLFGAKPLQKMLEATQEQSIARKKAERETKQKAAEGELALEEMLRQHPTVTEQAERLKSLGPDEFSRLLLYSGRDTPEFKQAEIGKIRAEQGKLGAETGKVQEETRWMGPKAQAEIGKVSSEARRQVDQGKLDRARAKRQEFLTFVDRVRLNQPAGYGGIGVGEDTLDTESLETLPPDVYRMISIHPNESVDAYRARIGKIYEELGDDMESEQVRASIRAILKANKDKLLVPADDLPDLGELLPSTGLE